MDDEGTVASAVEPVGRRLRRASPSIPCARCLGSATPRPDGAHFCPRCGSAWPGRTPTPTAANWPGASPSHRPAGRRTTPGTTAVVVGYAAALFKLGRRYETGLSWKRNLPEAVRCYRKAAKLGNEKALLQVSLPPPAPLRVLELAPDEVPPIGLKDLEELLPPPTHPAY